MLTKFVDRIDRFSFSYRLADDMGIHQLFHLRGIAGVIDDLTGILLGNAIQNAEKVEVLFVCLNVFLTKTTVLIEARRAQGDFQA